MENITEQEQQLNEFIGGIVNAIFNGKARKIAKSKLEDPRLANSLQKYIDNTEKFRQELKSIGYSSKEDLKKALAKNPKVKDYIEF